MKSKTVLAAIALLSSILSVNVPAQSVGQNVRVTTGIVVNIELITTNSKAGTGAAVGGALGWYSAKGKKSSKRYRNAIIGAGAGAAVSNQAQGDRSGAIYSVKTGSGSLIEVVSDQTQMRIGDCVVVEESGNKANVRRIEPTACQPESAAAVSQLEEEFKEEAAECATAKQEVVNAKANEELDLAMRKAKILCNN